MKFALITFGCRVNQADSASLDKDLRAVGGQPALPEEADLVVVNTCSVTASADQSARKVIRRIGRRNPEARIVVTGCYATRAAEEIGLLPGVAAVVSNSRKERLTTDLRPYLGRCQSGLATGRVALRSRRPLRAGQCTCFVCRPGATRRAPTASFPGRADVGEVGRFPRCSHACSWRPKPASRRSF